MLQDFHTKNARLTGILALTLGTIGISATLLSAVDWNDKIALSIFFGTFVIIGGPTAFGGGQYRSWFDDGRFYWVYPYRFYGRNDSCRVEDIVELQHRSREVEQSVPSYHLLLRDGTKKYVGPECIGRLIGGDDGERLYRALQEHNPSIRYVRL